MITSKITKKFLKYNNFLEIYGFLVGENFYARFPWSHNTCILKVVSVRLFFLKIKDVFRSNHGKGGYCFMRLICNCNTVTNSGNFLDLVKSTNKFASLLEFYMQTKAWVCFMGIFPSNFSCLIRLFIDNLITSIHTFFLIFIDLKDLPPIMICFLHVDMLICLFAVGKATTF